MEGVANMFMGEEQSVTSVFLARTVDDYSKARGYEGIGFNAVQLAVCPSPVRHVHL